MRLSLQDWFNEIRLRQVRGHELELADSPMRRTFGMKDLQTDEVIETGLVDFKNGIDTLKFKSWCQEHGVDLDALRLHMCSHQGRASLLKALPKVA